MGRLARLKLSTKFILITVGLLILFSAIISVILNTVVADSIKEAATEKAKGDLALGYETIDLKYPGEWRSEGDKLYKGSALINENEEIVDYIGELTGGTVTIFNGDTRVTTNVVKDGKRAVGTQASEEVVKHTLEGGHTFYGEANVVGHEYQTAYQPIKDQNGKTIGMWYVGAPVDMVSKAISNINLVLLSSLAGLILVSLLVILPFTNRMNKRLLLLGQALEHSGKGDFTIEVFDKGGDEISRLAESYGKMRGNLGDLVLQIREAAETVAASAEELNAGAEETARATDSIASSVQEVASSADEQVKHTDELNHTVRTMTAGIRNIASGAEEVKTAVERNSSAAQTGAQIMEKTRQQVLTINEMTKATSLSIHQLQEKSTEIGSIINIITAISEQTNLLALNAAIEAARAGEHGKGFAVVAAEVRKLAEQSNKSASQIQELIGSIQKDISESVVSMENGRSAISEGIGLADEAKESFDKINDSIQSVNAQIGTVSQSVQGLDSGTENMLGVLSEIVGQIQQTSTASQSVAAATEEQSASMEEIYAFSQSLSSLAEDLRSSVQQFKL
ncbi:MAG TPA: methyl-accepting chemotaxis protein [Bacillus bacterium]|nr:methyl-accepting chemotaxis protein [Bacillus sp. (in: firmicutes)]